MNRSYQKIINDIKNHGRECVVTPYGIFSRSGKFIGFASYTKTYSNSSRNVFLSKYFNHFSNKELEKVIHLKSYHLDKYKRYIQQAIKNNNFKSARILIENAEYLYDSYFNNNRIENRYFRLKDEF